MSEINVAASLMSAGRQSVRPGASQNKPPSVAERCGLLYDTNSDVLRTITYQVAGLDKSAKICGACLPWCLKLWVFGLELASWYRSWGCSFEVDPSFFSGNC